MTRSELIAAMEKATGPDRELDAEIVRVAFNAGVTWRSTNYTMEVFPVVHWEAPHPYAGMKEPVPPYTASIDAALTLAPETDGKRWYEIGQAWSQAVARVRIYPPSPWEGRTREAAAEAPTPALALCIAAIRAMEATDDGR